MILSPLLTTFLLFLIYHKIKNFDKENFKKLLQLLSENEREEILSSLSKINKKMISN